VEKGHVEAAGVEEEEEEEEEVGRRMHSGEWW